MSIFIYSDIVITGIRIILLYSSGVYARSILDLADQQGMLANDWAWIVPDGTTDGVS